MLNVGIMLQASMNRLKFKRLDACSTRKLLDSVSLFSYERRLKVTVAEHPAEVSHVAMGFKSYGCADARTKDTLLVNRSEVS